MRQNKGFTLIEILLVVSAIAILAGIVIIAVNPTKQLGDARNAQREADVNTILNAVYQYSIDNDGDLPSDMSTTATEICATNAASCTGLVDLTDLTTEETYLTSIPTDPSGAITTGGAGYTIELTDNSRVTVTATQAEQNKTITVTR